MMFKFLHAADPHLDSPLLELASQSAHYAARVDRASRDAFERAGILMGEYSAHKAAVRK